MSLSDDFQAAVAAPSAGMTWPQLGLAVIFVLIVALAWRQVTHFIMGEL
jgi:hypothetical protein